MVVGSQRRRRALAADCDVQDSARQLIRLGTVAWNAVSVAVSLRALTRSVCLADALCPPRPSLAAGRALPALVPISLGAPRPAQPPLV